MSKFSNIIKESHSEPSSTAGASSPDLHKQETINPPPPLVEGSILEQFIRMRDALLKSTPTLQSRAFGVTSSKAKEGKTTVAICLAMSFALADRANVLLVDADFRHPTIHTFFSVSKDPGLADLSRGALHVQKAVVRIQSSPLCILPSGTAPSTPLELLSAKGLGEALRELRALFDTIIVDTPSVKAFPDFELIGKHLDGTVLVVEADKTQLPLIRGVKTRLDNANIPLLGVTMNRIKNVIPPFITKYIGLD